MLRPVVFLRRPFLRWSKPHAVILLAAAIAGGCSADIGRFDSSAFNFDDSRSAGDPVPSAPVRRNVGGPAFDEPTSAADSRVPPLDYRPAPSAAAARRIAPVQEPEPRRMAVPAQYRPQSTGAAAPARAAQPIAKAQQIEVQPGDTLYGLSKRHGVPVAHLMSVNDLGNPNIKPGQMLYLPAAESDLPVDETRQIAQQPVAKEHVETASVPPPPLGSSGGEYTVKRGDNLYGIARALRVSVAELQSANGITDVRNLKPGMVLKTSAARDTRAVASAPAGSPPPSSAPQTPASEPKRETALHLPDRQPVVTPVEAQVAPLATPAPVERPAAPAAAAPAPQAPKLRWPARGRIIAAFGTRPDGTQNDGINVAVPLGTEVHAAESGSVHYAGSELKSYGNLVLIKHDNGWVTAYAHNDQILVKRGDRVQRGQVISRAGKSGNVDQPQIHFEVRQEAKPVDPMPYLERL